MRNVRLHKSGRYEARVQIQNKYFSAYGDTELEALENLEEKSSRSPKLPESPSLKQWMEAAYLPTLQIRSEKQQTKAKYAISKLGRLGEKPIHEITRHDFQLFFNKLPLGTETQRTIRSIYVRAFNLAEADDVVTKNPLRFVTIKSTLPAAKEVLSAQELRKLIEHSRGYAPHPVVILAGLMGLRIGEIARLQPHHFADPGKLKVPGTKTAGSLREIPLHPQILQELAKETFPLAGNKDRAREALIRAGFRAQLPQSLHSHLLRHTYSSLLEWIGCPLDIRSRLLGHGKRHITERYSHSAWQNWKIWQDQLVLLIYPELEAKLGTTASQTDKIATI